MVLGAGTTAAWVDLDGFVVAITTREVPLLPNAVALAAGSGALERSGLAAGTPARVAPGRIDLGPLRITWSPADPRPGTDGPGSLARGPEGGRRTRSGPPHRNGGCGQRPAPLLRLGYSPPPGAQAAGGRIQRRPRPEAQEPGPGTAAS